MPNDPVAEAREKVARRMEDHLWCCALRQPECNDYAPPEHRGHWRDWHRGHGCRLDPDREVACTCGNNAALDALIAAAEARGRASVMPSLDAVVWLASKTGFAFSGLAAPLRPLVDASADWTTKRRHAAIDEVVAWFRAALSTPEVPRG